MIAITASAVGLLGLAHTGIQASIVEAPLVATVFQVELNRETAPPAEETETLAAVDPEPIENLPSTAFLSAPRQETLYQIATAGRPLSEDEIRMLARAAGWPEHTLGELLEVAWCESTYNPVAMNGQAIHGLMQVHTLWFNYSGLPRSQWSNALVNLQVALAAYNYDLQQGHAPWTQWQCRPGGIRIPTEEFAPHLPDIALEDDEESDEASDDGDTAGTGQDAAGGSNDSPSGEPTSEGSASGDSSAGEPGATPTPAPWDLKPSWPPVVETPSAEGTGAENTGEPTPAEEPTSDDASSGDSVANEPGIVVIHQPDAPNESP